MRANDLAQRVAEIVRVLDEHGWRGFRTICAKANSVKAVTFNLDARYTEIDVRIGGDLVKRKTREIEACLVYERRRQGPYPGQSFGLILRFLSDVTLGPAAASGITADAVRTRQISAERKLIRS